MQHPTSSTPIYLVTSNILDHPLFLKPGSAPDDLYIHCLHSVTACACAEVEVPILVKNMAAPYGWLIFQEGPYYPSGPFCPTLPYGS